MDDLGYFFENAWLIIGHRRSGKTSLLKKIAERHKEIGNSLIIADSVVEEGEKSLINQLRRSTSGSYIKLNKRDLDLRDKVCYVDLSFYLERALEARDNYDEENYQRLMEEHIKMLNKFFVSIRNEKERVLIADEIDLSLVSVEFDPKSFHASYFALHRADLKTQSRFNFVVQLNSQNSVNFENKFIIRNIRKAFI
ncbi:MAG: hypothetical protein QXF25_01175 [Candidatus Pacearchaeota archaeon]